MKTEVRTHDNKHAWRIKSATWNPFFDLVRFTFLATQMWSAFLNDVVEMSLSLWRRHCQYLRKLHLEYSSE